MKMWAHLPVTLELQSSVETDIIDKETTPNTTDTETDKNNRRSLELVVGTAELTQHFGISLPLTNAMAKAIGFFQSTFSRYFPKIFVKHNEKVNPHLSYLNMKDN